MISLTHKSLADKLTDPCLNGIISSLSSGSRSLSVSGLNGTCSYVLASLISRALNRPFLYVFGSQAGWESVSEDLKFFTGQEIKTLRGKLLFKRSLIDNRIDADRHRRLGALISAANGGCVCAEAASLFELVIPGKVLKNSSAQINVKDRSERSELIARLSGLGYRKSDFVTSPCEMSVRGSIVDLYSAGHDLPLRIEYEGSEIRSIRYFSPGSQKSLKRLQSAAVYPVSELLLPGGCGELKNRIAEAANEKGVSATLKNAFLNLIESRVYTEELEQLVPYAYKERESLLSLMDERCLVFLDLQGSLEDEFERACRAADKHGAKYHKFHEILPGFEEYQLAPEEVNKRLSRFQIIRINDLITRSQVHFTCRSRSSRLPPSSAKTPVQSLADSIKELTEKRFEVFVVSYNENEQSKIRELLSDYNVEKTNYLTGSLGTGFISDDLRLAVFCENDFSEKSKAADYRMEKSTSSAFISSFSELKSGDFIVHKNFGIGRYKGLRKLEVGDKKTDFLECEYRDGNKLFVPVENLKLIQRYIGSRKVPLTDKLSGGGWRRKLSKVKKAVDKTARELLELYAKRKAIRGFGFSKRDHAFKEFEMEFCFEETADQSKAIEDVMSDMEKSRPMDRLICGDAGFGKTEIAMRASFKAAMDGKQTAFLVPTTLLADQHYDNFISRFKNHPVNIEAVSRFKTAAESRKIFKKLSEGFIDIIIGTHKLLGEKIKFRNLGLLIIDEEHKFGVRHKEKLKLASNGVDVISLSATPIPRSLQLSLADIRDISLVNTPPSGRMPVSVYIDNFNEKIIREAVMKELSRGGMVLFINNRIRSISEVAEKLKSLIPEASVEVTHGQMNEKLLEERISLFRSGRINLLVTTAIVESGLDIPRANTIIVNDAHKFGLADLYQLRGRVGRGDVKAHAYFLVPSVNALSRDARARLTKLSELQQNLGTGFKLALYDMEIRGAGSLFGEEQSGTIAEVGLELYLEMLQRAVRDFSRQKGKEAEDYDPEIKSYESAFIPEDYIENSGERLYYYKKLSSYNELKELGEIREEIADKFGKLPRELKTLIKILELKFRIKKFRISRVDIQKNHTLFALRDDSVLSKKFKLPEKIKIYYEEKNKYAEISKKLRELSSRLRH